MCERKLKINNYSLMQIHSVQTLTPANITIHKRVCLHHMPCCKRRTHTSNTLATHPHTSIRQIRPGVPKLATHPHTRIRQIRPRTSTSFMIPVSRKRKASGGHRVPRLVCRYRLTQARSRASPIGPIGCLLDLMKSSGGGLLAASCCIHGSSLCESVQLPAKLT